MDQPQNEDQNQNNDLVGSPDQTPDTAPQSSTGTSIPVNVADSMDAQGTDGVVDEVMEGVPSGQPAGELVGAAEQAVADAAPQSTSDELAEVANELQSMAEGAVTPDAPPAEESHDPMQQVLENEQQTTGMQDNAPDQPSEMPESQATEAVPSDEQTPDASMTNQFDSSSGADEATDQPSDGDPAGSMESMNELGGEPSPEMMSGPTEDTSSDTEQASETDETASPEVNASDGDQEESISVDAGAVSQMVQDQSGDVSSTDSEQSMDVAKDPGMSEDTLADDEPAAESSKIDDVVAPSAVAAAVAAGTGGENAITGTPEAASANTATSVSQTPMQHMKKSNKGMIIAVVALVTLLFGGGAVAAYMLQPSDSDTTDDTTSSEQVYDDVEVGDPEESTLTQTASPGESVEAKSIDDYKAACQDLGGKVTNASAYEGAGVHPVAVFEKGSDGEFAQSIVAFKDATWAVASSGLDKGQLVACISRKEASEVKIKECPITDAVTKVTASVDYYSSNYTVNVHEALTGKKLTSFENKSVSTDCPTNAAYDKNDPKIFAPYDQIALETSLKESVTAEL